MASVNKIKVGSATYDVAVASAISYSTTEQDTGLKWIDGKKIYQKTINFGELPNATSKKVAHDISNLDRIVRFEGCAYNTTTGGCLPVPFSATANNENIQMWGTPSIIGIQTGTNRSTFIGYITLQYTKTS